MAARKKDPAALRTVGLFTGKTVLEEAAVELEEESQAERTGNPLDMVNHAEETAIKWLGLDAFHAAGDDVKIAKHAQGHAVMVLVDTSRPSNAPYGTRIIKLSRAQWTKLKALAREDI